MTKKVSEMDAGRTLSALETSEERIAPAWATINQWNDLKNSVAAVSQPEDSIKITPIEGYQYIAHQEGVCGGRPTLIGHRLEPWHFMGWTKEQVLQDWDYVDPRKIEEAFRFLEENRAWCKQLAREVSGKL